MATGALRRYYRLTKPGIVYGNVFHAIVGFLIAHQSGLTIWTAVGLIVGSACVIASACVANNLLDRDIDARMKRTQARSLVTREIDVPAAVLYALILLTIGVVVLLKMTNVLTLVLSLIAYVWYVWIYGWAKRTTWHSTLVGTVPGALPIVAGYTAVSGHVDLTAWLLFALLVAWQMPHFYAIALYRKKEYAAAKLPIASVVLSKQHVYWQMIIWTVVYLASIVGLVVCGALHWLPGGVLFAGAGYWFVTMTQGKATLSDTWARKVFKQSLLLTIVLMACAVLNLYP